MSGNDFEARFVLNYKALYDLTPHLCSEVVSMIQSSGEPGSVQDGLDPEGAENHAIVFAALYLHSALDALQLWHRASTSDQFDMNVSVQGTAGVLRQVLESAAVAAWLVEEPILLGERGLAALWNDLSEQSKFPRVELYPDTSVDEAASRADLLALGMQGGLLNATGDRPEKPLIGYTGACKRVALDPNVFGTPTAEAFYRWSSGMAHGLPWAFMRQRSEVIGVMVRTTTGRVVPTGGELVVPKPNYAMLSLTLCAAHEAIRLTCTRLSGLKDAPQ